MMKKFTIYVFGLIAFTCYLLAQDVPDRFPEPWNREENYRMKVTARVIDENRQPLAHAPIKIKIHNVNDYKDEYNDMNGLTNAKGEFSAEGIGRGLAKIEVQLKDYYPSEKTVTCYQGTAEQIRAEGKFLPWNPVVDVMVKKVMKPIPMLVRLAWGGCKSWITPEQKQMGMELKWDLIEGDWVKPEGKGKCADLLVKFTTSRTDDKNHVANLEIRMANPDDGLIVLQELPGEESHLKFPRFAPNIGYELKSLTFRQRSVNGVLSTTPAKKTEGYLIRIRTQKEEGDKISSAIYGKITALNFMASSTGRGALPSLNLDYYLNLTANDRNLEYDQKNNLAPEVDKGLTWPP